MFTYFSAWFHKIDSEEQQNASPLSELCLALLLTFELSSMFPIPQFQWIKLWWQDEQIAFVNREENLTVEFCKFDSNGL